MPQRTQAELLQILADRVRTAGVGGLTTAQDLRVWGTDVIDSMFYLNSLVLAGVAQDAAVVHKTGNMTETVTGEKTFDLAKFSQIFVLPAALGAVVNGKIENDGTDLYYTSAGVRNKLLTVAAGNAAYAAANHTHPLATLSTAGFFSPAEKLKLAGLTVAANAFGSVLDEVGNRVNAIAAGDDLHFLPSDSYLTTLVTRTSNKNVVYLGIDVSSLDNRYMPFGNYYTKDEVDAGFAVINHTHEVSDIIGLPDLVNTSVEERLAFLIEDTETVLDKTWSSQKISDGLGLKANIAGQIFTGNISATNLSGTNTGDQDLSPYQLISNMQANLTASTTKYPTVNAVNAGLATKQNSLGFTPENVANKVGDLTSPNANTYLNTLGLVNALDGKVNTSVTITNGYGISIGGDLSSSVSVALNTAITDNRYLRKDVADDNGSFVLTLGGVIADAVTASGLTLDSLTTSTSNEFLVVEAGGIVKKKTLIIAGKFGVADSGGSKQFDVDLDTNIRFAGANDTTVTFDPLTKLVTISSIPGSGGGGAVVSFNSRTGAVNPVSGDYNTSMVPEVTNLYYTDARAIAAPLTGFSAATATAINSGDSILSGLGKAQGQLNAKVGNTRTISISGTAGRVIISGAETQDLSANRSWAIDLATIGTAGTYKSVTTDGYGRVTAGTNPTTLGGFGITNAYTKTESDGNYPLKDGTGAVGDWGIDITGSAAQWSGMPYGGQAGANTIDYVYGYNSTLGYASLLTLTDFKTTIGLATGGETLQTVINRSPLIQNNAYITYRSAGDDVVQFQNVAGTLQGYIGKLSSGAMVMLNAVSGQTLSMSNSGVMTHTGLFNNSGRITVLSDGATFLLKKVSVGEGVGNNYISFQSSIATEEAYMGFGSATPVFYIRNSVGNIEYSSSGIHSFNNNVHAVYFNMTGPSVDAVGLGDFVTTSGADGYLRRSSFASVKTALGLGTAAYKNFVSGDGVAANLINKVAAFDANGYLYANYINSSTGNSEASGNINQIIFTNGTDGFYRKASIAQLQAALSITSGGETLQSVTTRGNTTGQSVIANGGFQTGNGTITSIFSYASTYAIAGTNSAHPLTLRTNGTDWVTLGTNGALVSSGDVGLGGPAVNGGSNARWLALHGTAVNYSGGLVYLLDSSIKGYNYYQGGYVKVQGDVGTGVQLIVDGSTSALKIESSTDAVFSGSVSIGSAYNLGGYQTLSLGSSGIVGLMKLRSPYNSGNGAEFYQDSSGTIYWNNNSAFTGMTLNATGGLSVTGSLGVPYAQVGNVTIGGGTSNVQVDASSNLILRPTGSASYTYFQSYNAGANWGYVNGNGFNGNLTGGIWNNSSFMTFNWAGQSGQPAYVWGSDGNTSSYVWNPSNFNVASAQYTRAYDNYSFTMAQGPTTYPLGIGAFFVGSASSEGSWTTTYGSVLNVNTYSGGGGALQLWSPYGVSYNGGRLQYRIGDYDNGNVWSGWKTIANLSDFANSATITAAVAPTANTLALRDGSGYIEANFFRSVTAETNPQPVTPAVLYGGHSGQGYHYAFAAAYVQAFLGIPTGGDTLASVTARGASSSQYIQLGGQARIGGGSGTAYGGSDLELYRSGVSPVLAFHFGGTAASTLQITSSGNYLFTDGEGTAYVGINVSTVNAASTITAGSTISTSGTVNASDFNTSTGWFYSNAATGWYNNTYGGGIHMTDTSYVRVYNGKSFWADGNIRGNGLFANSGYFTENYGIGLVGLYDSSRYQEVFSMGAAYRPSTDGAGIGTSYGILWTHTNVAGESKSGLAHQMLITAAGVTQTAIGTGIWTLGVITGTSHLSIGGNAGFTGNVTSSSYVQGLALGVGSNTGEGAGLSLYGGSTGTSLPNYGIASGNTSTFGTHGAVTGDWATWNTISGGTDRGWIFMRRDSSNWNVASISASGYATFDDFSQSKKGHVVSYSGVVIGGIYQGNTSGIGANDDVNLLSTNAINIVATGSIIMGGGDYGELITITDNIFYCGMSNPASSIRVDVGGYVRAYDFIVNSDATIKTNIKPLESSLEKIMKLTGYSYNLIHDNSASIGVIAQEVQEIFPELVHRKDTLGVEYGKLVAPLIMAVKEQQSQIAELKSQVKRLQDGVS